MDLPNVKSRLTELAATGVFVGTTSWKYPGWCGQVYDEKRYLTRGKFSVAKFDRECLTEYAQTFPSVCVDAGYYKFPTEKYLEGLCSQVPTSFRFSFKVTDAITLKQFPNQPRHGSRAGKPNPDFLNAGLLRSSFLRPLESFRKHIGVLMFEFSQFQAHEFARGRDFVDALDTFLDELPPGWQYGVEIRNKTFLQPEYYEALRRHSVTHVFNSWTRMPSVSEQLLMDGSVATDFVASRFLITPGLTYAKAVEAFSPYNETKAQDNEARRAARQLIAEASQPGKRPSYIYVNNRLEGNALNTIEAIVQ